MKLTYWFLKLSYQGLRFVKGAASADNPPLYLSKLAGFNIWCYTPEARNFK